ncbi:MAG: site-specific DNA-methyltransferase [Acidimicrobiia bacterium]
MSEPYYQDDLVTLYHGDALSILPDITSAGCMVLDPPYHMSPNTFRGIDDGAASSIATPVRLLTETFRHAYRVLPTGGTAFIFCDWRRGPDTTYLASLAGLRISTCLAWTRNRSGTGGMYRGAWDPIYVASKGVPTIRDKSAIPNVINADHPTIKDHPYEKPAKVWNHLLSRIPATVVLDPFAGSSTSADVAIRLGHQWIGIEADERHCESAAKRFGQDSLFTGGDVA